MPELSVFKKYFDPLFTAFLKKQINHTVQYHPDFAKTGNHLIRLLAGGKRLRPFIMELSYRSAGGNDIESILPVLFALELFQAFALIHDDIIDSAKTRHGVETIHTKFDVNQAILVGDQCLVWAMKSIALCEKTTKRELTIFMQLAEETNIGQMVDTSLCNDSKLSQFLLDTSIELKTARYTFTYPAILGLSFASPGGIDEATINAYKSLGSLMGQAFQRINDLADVMATQEELGRKPGSDITEDTLTYLFHYFEQHATDAQKSIYEVYRAQPLDHNDMTRIHELLNSVGAIDAEKKLIEEKLLGAKKVIETIPIPVQCIQVWQSLIHSLRLKLGTY